MSLPPLHLCWFCHEEVDPTQRNVMRRVTGWTASRPGATLSVIGADEVGQFAHAECAKYGPPSDQLSMF